MSLPRVNDGDLDGIGLINRGDGLGLRNRDELGLTYGDVSVLN